MPTTIFERVKDALHPRLPGILPDLLPGGAIRGREYVCSSLQGGSGSSCATNLDTGIGSDFATGESWKDIIGLWAAIRGIRQGEAARELAEKYSIRPDDASQAPRAAPAAFILITPVPDDAPKPPDSHYQHGKASFLWCYQNQQGQTLAYTARFDLPDGSKAILPLCYGQLGDSFRWQWKSLPEPRPLYGLQKLAAMPEAPILLGEGEKTADAAQGYFPSYAVLTWSGGANAVAKADLSPLNGRKIIIWPDNDEPGFRAALNLAELLDDKAQVKIVQPPDTLPEKWDLADVTTQGFIPSIHIDTALPVAEFIRKAVTRFPALGPSVETSVPDNFEDLTLKEWPLFPVAACPGIVGEFVSLATRDSEADPAAVCITMLTRFAAEIYGYAEGKGPYIHVGETIHPPRLFAVICGNSSKARKGTSLYPVNTLFSRQYCLAADVRHLPLPARESGGPLSTGEGLACQVRDESEEERQRRQKLNPNEPLRDSGDKRLMIQDEEFASGLACTKREGNTLSMGLRCFWDSGDYAPLTKNNPVRVKNAHISIITHITMQELAVVLADVQAFNGFGNRFLWICARRSKLVALPSQMPMENIAPLQNELWRRIGHAQQCGLVTMAARAKEQWESVYPELSKEHSGLAGCIINRAEAQTMRLALIYALLDGQNTIDSRHLDAALALWGYAQASALYIFGDKAADPLEEKILEALKQGPLTATELSAVFSRNLPKERLQPLLQQLEAQQRITITKDKPKGIGRPKITIMLREIYAINEKTKLNEFYENTQEGL
ncbi:MAG: DUF6371 domain-containing protein [Desulfovibrio sp.]|jgi:hypothetical protein|nr:DUF6371 domain-containing protein [Desulfovibrio sp.]